MARAESGKNRGSSRRGDIVTALGKEKNLATPRWEQSDDTYSLHWPVGILVWASTSRGTGVSPQQRREWPAVTCAPMHGPQPKAGKAWVRLLGLPAGEPRALCQRLVAWEVREASKEAVATDAGYAAAVSEAVASLANPTSGVN